MNEKSINSLISAYHDGELSVAERGEVEKLLATSPEAQAELASYREMSVLLRETARPALATDLTPLVMQAIDQMKPQVETVVLPQRRPAWARWTAVAVVAAGLVLAVRMNLQGPQQGGVALAPEPNSVAPTVAHNSGTTKPVTITEKNPPVKNGAEQNTTGQNTVIASNAAVAAPTNVAPTPDKGVGTAPVSPELQLTQSDIPVDVIQNLKKANPGKIVRFLKQSGKDVAVFHLMVLDTKPGLESLQMILSAQQISGPMGQVGQGGVMAIYVEADQDQMDKVIAQLQSKEQEQFVALAVQQSPMKAEAVQRVLKDQTTAVASQQVPLKDEQLQSLGVTAVQPQQLVASGVKQSVRPPVEHAENGNDKPIRKVLIVLEKVPESLLPK